MPRIPALALSNPDADQLERIAGDGKTVSVRIKVDSSMPGAQSGNVIAAVVGREVPEGSLSSAPTRIAGIWVRAPLTMVPVITMAALELIKDAGWRCGGPFD